MSPMSIFRGLTLVITNPTFVLLVWSFTSGEVATLPLVAKTQKEFHHVIFHSPDIHVRALRTLGCNRGADGRPRCSPAH
jgi:hypothetical protein